jgi:hypothetical protein
LKMSFEAGPQIKFPEPLKVIILPFGSTGGFGTFGFLTLAGLPSPAGMVVSSFENISEAVVAELMAVDEGEGFDPAVNPGLENPWRGAGFPISLPATPGRAPNPAPPVRAGAPVGRWPRWLLLNDVDCVPMPEDAGRGWSLGLNGAFFVVDMLTLLCRDARVRVQWGGWAVRRHALLVPKPNLTKKEKSAKQIEFSSHIIVCHMFLRSSVFVESEVYFVCSSKV